MARLARWAQKLFGRIKSPPTVATAPQAATSTYNASKERSEQTIIRPAGPPPRAVHERHWQKEERRRAKSDGGGSILVLLYDDMDGGELLEQARFYMEEEVPTYLCGEYVYNLDIITSASDPILDYGQGFGHSFFSVILAYDIHSQDSFDEVARLYDTICRHQKSGQSGFDILVLGLKADLDSADGRVPRDIGERFAWERECSFAECSAKSGDGV
ncbi:hypothetical protein INS49_002495 [Diaporthe citri]|uniref:uncharacterized protein n=1 Tax=Diaporthe citri TaxID=83186 RepID=UPI001C7F679B|nr:uncharacterized protein INS49_002495 [Diaporthe citri]KAG6368290.1 hypothetical protein INS49_002495 [Diaporthe citri]